ncbi:MAG TPA: hypothetical protein VFO19_11285 [Vicinamibacterales bacterium]|nr:hypothetical protein [Vicinamibacterales bacterium]
MTESDIQSGEVRTPPRGRLRDNALLLVALALPLLVVALFLVMTMVPRYTVAAPRYDLVLSAIGSWDYSGRHSMTFSVRDNRVVADFRPPSPNSAPIKQVLYVFDHTTLDLREVTVATPTDLVDGDSRTVVVEALASRPVIAQTRAPDGYEFQMRNSRSPGIVGEVFGMRRYEQQGTIRNRGRAIPISIPGNFTYSVNAIGWLGSDERRD